MKKMFSYIKTSDCHIFNLYKVSLIEMAVKITLEERVEKLEYLVERRHRRLAHMFKRFCCDMVFNCLYNVLARCLDRLSAIRNPH